MQHALIMLESEVPHFFPKMHLKVYREPFCVYPPETRRKAT